MFTPNAVIHWDFGYFFNLPNSKNAEKKHENIMLDFDVSLELGAWFNFTEIKMLVRVRAFFCCWFDLLSI